MKHKYISLSKYLVKQLVRQGADYVVVSADDGKSTQLKFVDNKIVKSVADHLSGVDIFAVKNKAVAFTSLKDLTKESADKTIKQLLKFINLLPSKPDYNGLAKGPFKYKPIKDIFDKKILDIDSGAVDLVESGINAALAEGAKRCSGVLETGYSEDYILTSEGAEGLDKGTNLYFSIRAFTDKNASGSQVSNSRMLNKFDPEFAGKFAGNIASMAKHPKKGKSGKLDVVLETLPFTNILGNVSSASSIFSVEAGLSFLAKKLGKRVASPKFTMYDDGSLKNGIASGLYDDEGVPVKKTKVIDKGILKTYLHNYSTAKKYNTKTTGNAGLDAPDSTNVVVEPGNYSTEQLISQIKKGIYITNVWYTRFSSYSTGDFSTIPRDGAFYIENGEIKHPVNTIRISENILNMLMNIKELGNEMRHVEGWDAEQPSYLPPTLIKNVNITVPKE